MNHWKNILVKPESSILQTISIIDQTGLRAALVVDENNRLQGMVTDGDIRRCVLKNISLAEPISRIMNTDPVVASQNDSREKVLYKLQSKHLHHIPILNDNNQVIGFETLDSLLSLANKDNPIIIMAGGMGKRLYPLTMDCPKPLLKIGNKPVLEILLENFIKIGFHQFYFAVNYKAEMIKAHFKNGEQWGIHIHYLEESNPLGTAGALTLLPTYLLKSLIVINADVVTSIDFQCLLEFHAESKVDATMCVREHTQIIPYGVIERDEKTHHLLNIVEKPTKNFFVNAGIYILEPTLLKMLTSDTFCDMPDLLMTCLKHDFQIATFPMREYWLDIGRHEDLTQAHHDYEKGLAC